MASSSSPISELPVELLIDVFHYLSSVDQPRRADRLSDRLCVDSLGWVTVTHVCKYWREVAINCPTLWATFSPTELNAKWIQIFLDRSADAPKSLHFDISTHVDASILEKCLAPGLSGAVSSRLNVRQSEIRKLSCASLFHDLSGIVEELGPDLSSLEHLALSQPSLRAFGGVVLLRHIHLATRLKTVKFRNVTLLWSPSELFTSITELHVEIDVSDGDRYDDESRPSAERLCAVLSSLTQVEKLFLRNIFPAHPPSPLCSANVTLPDCCLSATFEETLAIEGLLHLFARMAFAPATSVVLRIVDEAFDLESHPSSWENLFLSEVSRRAGPDAPRPPQVIQVSSSPEPREMAIGLGVSFEYADDCLGRPAFILQDIATLPSSIVLKVVNYRWNPDQLWLMLLRMTAAVDASQAVALSINGHTDRDERYDSRAFFEPHPDAAGLFPLCQSATNARVLAINNEPTLHAIFHILAHGRGVQRLASDLGYGVLGHLVLPKLETLALIDSVFLGLSELIENDIESDLDSCSIIDCLKIRKSNGFPITTILAPKEHEHTEGWEAISALAKLLPY